MYEVNKNKIINDPVYGFISIPSELIFDLIEHPYFQRLRRIRQLGLSHYVYPGALHTRFHHALGAMHIMLQAVETIRSKGHEITQDECESVCIAILLHDIGHGPFSHALESSLVKNIPHESLSLLIMDALNVQFKGKLSTAIRIFKDEYPKKFLHQLVSGQLDMDRLDYLARDSFFTGVSEGVISVDRILKMLNVYKDELVVDDKGIYSIEKFIIARRLMYWQVYLHKTVLAAEMQLINVLKRARELYQNGTALFTTSALHNFLKNSYTESDFAKDPTLIELFCKLDDFDIFSCLKEWMNASDFTLAHLSSGMINRVLYKVRLQAKPFSETDLAEYSAKALSTLPITNELLPYYLFTGTIENHAYTSNEENINILFKGNTVKDMAKASDNLSLSALSKPVVKHYVCVDRMLL